MSQSYSSVTTTNFDLTPVRVTYDSVDLGGTLSNAVVTLNTEKADLKADQFGNTVVDRRISGHKFMVTTELAEIVNKDNWKVVFPHFAEVTSGLNKGIYSFSQIGYGDYANSKILKLHPLSLPDADLSRDYTFYKAHADGNSELTYGPTGQLKLKIIWNIFPDTSLVPARFFFYGDPAIGLVAASAGSPVFTGTGNGTMTSVAVYSGVSVTETITAKVVTPQTNAGVFEVHGSVSGPLGLATVGIAFVSPVISFTINDGSTDFVLNDQFTVAVTAANYV